MAKFEKNIEKNYVRLLLKGDKLFKERKFEKAIRVYLQIYDFYKERNNENITVEVLKKISDCYIELEKYEEALTYLERILYLSKKLKNDLLKACTLSDIGLVYKEFYDINKAETLFIQANKIFNELGSIINVVVSLIQLATVEIIKGNLEESLKKLNSAKDLAIKYGIKNQLSIIHGKLAELSLKLGNIDEFKENYQALLDFQKYNENPQHLAVFLNNTMAWLAQLNIIDGSEQIDLLNMNLEVCNSNNLIGSKITCLINFSRYYSRKGNFKIAEDFLNQAFSLANENNLVNEKIGIFNGYGLLYRENGDIESRKYYIRTPDGKKLVSDRQLQYLFRNEDLDFLYLFKFTIKLNKEDLGVINLFDDLPCLRYFEEFVYDLPKEDIKFIKGKQHTQFTDVFPYLMLCTLSQYFRRSWAIKLISDNDFIINSTVPLKKYEHLQIPLPSNESKLNPLSIDIRDYLKESWLFHDFFIPPNVNINIDKSLLQLEHEDFIFKIGVQSTNLSSFGGQDYFKLSFTCFYETKFNFPETNFELYEEYHQLALSIKEIIKRNWDYESYLEKNQYRLLNSINEKLDKLMSS